MGRWGDGEMGKMSDMGIQDVMILNRYIHHPCYVP